MFFSISLLKVCHIQGKSIVLCFCLKEKNIICDKKYNFSPLYTYRNFSDLVSKFDQLSHATEQVFRVKTHVILV